MTTPHKAAMQQALEVLQRASDAGYSIECEAAIAALTAAIDAPEHEPVAWLDPWTQKRCVTDYEAYGARGIPLYAYPPSRQPVNYGQALPDTA